MTNRSSGRRTTARLVGCVNRQREADQLSRRLLERRATPVVSRTPDILLKNKGRLGVSLSNAGLVDQLRREDEGSLERVLPLKERLARTDLLIDALVYQLYGLTEEKIGVVEERNQ